jgi:hypothetical protein
MKRRWTISRRSLQGHLFERPLLLPALRGAQSLNYS